MKKRNILAAMAALVLSISGCDGFLDKEVDHLFTDDVIFNDEVMMMSVLSDMYGSVNWGQHLGDWGSFQWTDDAERSSGGPETGSNFGDDHWRTYDYGYIRRANLFLKGIREASEEAVDAATKTRLEGEIRFLKAWTFFNTCRSLGGMPIIRDEIFSYESNTDVGAMQYPRSTEAEMYDFIIEECQAVFNMLPAETQTNGARANRWAAKMLEARAALYAASIAEHNNKMASPITTPGGEVGIPASKAAEYYQKALTAAEAVINSGVYSLKLADGDTYDELARNFYETTSVKGGNPEVIWTQDRKYPGNTTGFTTSNNPKSHAEETNEDSWGGGILNLVEEFEHIDTDTPGKATPFISQENGTYKFYNSADEEFRQRDPRLWGTLIYPGAVYRGNPVVLQAGQLNRGGSGWEKNVYGISGINGYDANGILITSQNGPRQNNEQFINKTGFFFRKFLDETPQSGTRGTNSTMWTIRFRLAEAYMIACEASFALGDNAKATGYINVVRNRAGVKPLTAVTFDNIVHEKRVEFAFEDHRYWDLKRWRIAHQVWNGNNNDRNARHRVLWPYLVVAPGDPNDGKWAFEEDFSFMQPNARNFQMKNYYNFLSNDWLNNNPKLVKNPYQ